MNRLPLILLLALCGGASPQPVKLLAGSVQVAWNPAAGAVKGYNVYDWPSGTAASNLLFTNYLLTASTLTLYITNGLIMKIK